MDTIDLDSRTETTPEDAAKYNQELMERVLNEQNEPDNKDGQGSD